MPIVRILPAFVCLATLCALAPQPQAQTVGAPAARVIVKFRQGSSLHIAAASAARAGAPLANASALSQRVGLALVDGPSISERTQVVQATGMTSEELAARLAQEPDVEYAVPDGRKQISVAPNDPLYPDGVPGNGPAVGQWYLRAPSST